MTRHHSALSVQTLCAGLAFVGMLALATPKASAQQTFHTPDEAAARLADAVKSGAQ